MQTKHAVWNRALDSDATGLRAGDVVLRDALRFHSLAMSGGALSALESIGQEAVTDAAEGLTYLGAADAAEAVRWLAGRAQTLNPDDEDALDALEGEADDRYNAAVPSDSVLVEAFEARFDVSPEDFAPVG